jgi:hypothetical protein
MAIDNLPRASVAAHSRTTSPWWISLVFGFGLLCVFLGCRAFETSDTASTSLTYLGVGIVAVTVLLRAWTFFASTGDRRRVERTLLLLQLGTVLALVLYWLSIKMGTSQIGGSAARTMKTPLTILWCVVLVASIIPHFMVEIGLGVARRTRFDFASNKNNDNDGVEYMRVRDIGWSGLSIGFAAAFLMVTCNVANQRNVRRDVSYFKTSSPGASTQAIVTSASEPLKVLLFFPAVNEVKAEARNYFEALASTTGKVTIEEHDRMVAAELAAKYKVSKDGSIVLVKGDKSELIDVDTDIEKARKGSGKLRNLDREINAALMKVMREKRKAYITVGHGELTDRASLSPMLKDKIPERQATLVKQALTMLGYESIDLNPPELATEVPTDATVLLILGPSQAFDQAEVQSLDRFVTRGGRLLYALNPLGENDLGALGTRLGVSFDRALLTDDKSFYPERGTDADFRNVATTQVSAHASTTTLSRASRMRLPVVMSGSLKDQEFAAIAGTTEKPKRTYILKAMDSTWADRNGNLKFDAAAPVPAPAPPTASGSAAVLPASAASEVSEKRERYNVAAAVEGPRIKLDVATEPAAGSGSGNADDKDKKKDAKPTDKDGFRALVYANANFFADAASVDPTGRMRKTMMGGDFFMFDAIRWLGGEEVFSGEVVSEDDKPIKHTKNEDAAWFQLTILGAPLLVLGLGLFGTFWRKRRRLRASDRARAQRAGAKS